MALSKTTQDHDEIRQWAEKRGGKPAEVASTERNGQTGILRIEFPGATNANDSNLKEISWDEFFEKFDQSNLSLVYQEVTSEGAESNFNKLVHPENVSPSAAKGAKKAPAKKSAGTTATSKTAAKKTSATSATAKKASASKTATKTSAKAASKVPAKTAAKTPAKKSAAKKVPAKKSAAKKAPAKKSAAKKSSYKAAAKSFSSYAGVKGGSKGYQGGRGPNKPATKAAAAKKSMGSKTAKRK